MEIGVTKKDAYKWEHQPSITDKANPKKDAFTMEVIRKLNRTSASVNG